MHQDKPMQKFKSSSDMKSDRVADLQNLNIKLLSPFQLPIQSKPYFPSKIKLFQDSLAIIQILNCWSFSVYGETDKAALCGTAVKKTTHL